jgi:hypothetical protein
MFTMSEERARWIDAACKISVAMGVLIGGGWSAYTYFDHLERDSKTAALEARKPFESKRLDLYLELTNVTSQIAGAKDATQQAAPMHQLQDLTFGSAAVLADKNVQDAVEAFRRCALSIANRDCKGKNPGMWALEVARQCRISIASGWDVYLPADAATWERLEESRQ